jgi:hypothetical protein
MGVDADVDVARVQAVVLGVRHGDEERQNSEH